MAGRWVDGRSWEFWNRGVLQVSVSELENRVLPPGTNESWRTWLLTGIRRAPVDRRRVRGAHKGLKKMLVEGMTISADHPYSWKEFSDAMVRQSVGDAVGALPAQDAQVVKLAYFGGMSNHDIADQMGLSVAAVERRLREAVARISHHVERGRSLGRRAFGAVIVWVSGRWLGDSFHHAVQAGAIAVAAGIVAAYPAQLDRAGPQSSPQPAHVQAAAMRGGTLVAPNAPPSRPSSQTV